MSLSSFNNRKMEDNEVTCSKAFEEIDIKIESLESLEAEQDLDSGNAQDNFPARKYVVMPKRGRGRPRKKRLEDKIVHSVIKETIDETMTIDYKSGLKRDRFRPIRPKPISSAVAVSSKNKLLEMSSPLNVPTLMSNRYIFTTPLLDRNKTSRHASTFDSFEKRNNVKVNDDDMHMDSAALAIEERNVYEDAADRNSNTLTINNSLRKSTLHSQKGSIELFFESMAQTVLNLPMEVQADIKMQICKIVTNAEVKYCGSQTKLKSDYGN